MKIDIVKFNPEGDGVTAVYIDGKLHTHGDYYHDKIDNWVEGFIDGLKFAEVSFDEDGHDIPGDKCKLIHEMGHSPPLRWPDRKYCKHRAEEVAF